MRVFSQFSAGFAALALLGCAGAQGSAIAPLAATDSPGAQVEPPVPNSDAAAVQTDGAAVQDAYRLGPGDKIRLIVFNEEGLSGEFVIDGSGQAALPLIGEVAAAGLTARVLEQSIAAKLADGYLNDPRVNVEVLTFRPFYILGEVGEPGDYQFSEGLTVLNAIATARGFTYRAATKRVFIKRYGELEERAYELTPSLLVGPGDTIRVAERRW